MLSEPLIHNRKNCNNSCKTKTEKKVLSELAELKNEYDDLCESETVWSCDELNENVAALSQ